VEEGLPDGARIVEVKEGDTSDLRLAHFTIDLLLLERIHSLDVLTLRSTLVTLSFRYSFRHQCFFFLIVWYITSVTCQYRIIRNARWSLCC
jgi:hypothetical protein